MPERLITKPTALALINCGIELEDLKEEEALAILKVNLANFALKVYPPMQ